MNEKICKGITEKDEIWPWKTLGENARHLWIFFQIFFPFEPQRRNSEKVLLFSQNKVKMNFKHYAIIPHKLVGNECTRQILKTETFKILFFLITRSPVPR